MATYRMDYLTRKVKKGPWYVQLRVPDRLRGMPPFGDRVIFSQSLKTKDHGEAVKRRDTFLKEIGFVEDKSDRQEREAERKKEPHDHYWDALKFSMAGRTQAELEEDRRLVQDLIEDIVLDTEHLTEMNPDREVPATWAKRRSKLEAQRAAIDRAIRELTREVHQPIEERHPFEITIKKAFTIYEARMKTRKLKDKTVARMWPAYERFVAFNNGRDMPIGRVGRQLVYLFIECYQDKGLAKATIRNDLSYFIGCFKYLQQTGHITDTIPNPFLGQELKHFEEAEAREVFSKDQLIKLIAAMADDPELRALTYVGFYTGMRLEEVFKARLGNVSGTTVFLVAEKGSGKTKAATRTVPVHAELEKALKQLGYMPKEGERIPWATSTSDALGKRFGRVKKTVMEGEGISDHTNQYVFHSLRHGFATALNTAGFQELHLAELTGHSKGTAGRTEASKTYIKGLPITNLVAMIKKLPTIPSPKTIDSDRLQRH